MALRKLPVINFAKPVTLHQDLQWFLIVLGFCVVSLIVMVSPLDGDTWWHLRIGEESFTRQQPLAIDLFSYTRFGESYISHSWLTDLILFLIFDAFGFIGLSVWIGGLAILALCLVYFQMEGPGVYRTGLIFLTGLLLLPFLKARPQMVSLAFLLGEAWILDTCWTKKQIYDLLLIPFFTLWSNLHGGFLIGLFYGVLFITGQFLDDRLGRSEVNVQSKGKRKFLIIILAICLLAVMIHPMGINVWKTLTSTMNSSTGANMIMEWSSPDFHAPSQQVYLWWLALIVGIVSLSNRKLTSVDILCLISFTVMGFIWRRHLAFLVVFGAILLSKHLWEMMLTVWNQPSGRWVSQIKAEMTSSKKSLVEPSPRSARWIFWLVTAIMVAASLTKLYLITTPSQIESREKQLFPYAARSWIEQNHPPGRLLNSYNWGGYFEWYLRDYPVFLDSRADLFGDEIIGQWLDVMNAREGWLEILEYWDVGTIVIEPDWHVVDLLPYHGWKELYRDDQAVIFGRSEINPDQY
jgi:hypothetical protein